MLLAGCGHFPGFELRVGGARDVDERREPPSYPGPWGPAYAPPSTYAPVQAPPWTPCREPAPAYPYAGHDVQLTAGG